MHVSTSFVMQTASPVGAGPEVVVGAAPEVVVGATPLQGAALNLAKQVSPPEHSASVPEGHAVPHFPFACPQLVPHREVATRRRDVVVGRLVVVVCAAQGLPLKLPKHF